MREVSIITNPSTINAALETWFFQNVLLQKLPFGLEWEIEKARNSVVIYLELTEINVATINTLKSNNNKVVLCQMGDENMAKYHIEAYESCDLILRNYYFSEIFQNQGINHKLMWIPNGYRSGVGPREAGNVRPSEKRHFLASFMGWLDNSASFGNERKLFADAAVECGPDLYLNRSDSFSRGYNVGLYSAVLEYSVFCPCPAGNSPETIRLYDALELGCIPISLKQEFLSSGYAISEPPFPLLDSWAELPNALKSYREQFGKDPYALTRLQQSCLSWWQLFKESVSGNIAAAISELQRDADVSIK
jgi:hypothetical protein